MQYLFGNELSNLDMHCEKERVRKVYCTGQSLVRIWNILDVVWCRVCVVSCVCACVWCGVVCVCVVSCVCVCVVSCCVVCVVCGDVWCLWSFETFQFWCGASGQSNEKASFNP